MDLDSNERQNKETSWCWEYKSFGVLTVNLVRSKNKSLYKTFDKRFISLTLMNDRNLAFQLVERNKIKHNFNRHTKIAGQPYTTAFWKRHPELTLQNLEATALARAHSFYEGSVSKCFVLLEEMRSKTNYPAHRIFNVDESGFTIVLNKSSKVAKRVRNWWVLSPKQKGVY